MKKYSNYLYILVVAIVVAVFVTTSSIAVGENFNDKIHATFVDRDTQYTQNRYREVLEKNDETQILSVWKNDKATSVISLASKAIALSNVKIAFGDFTSNAGRLDKANFKASFMKSTTAYNGNLHIDPLPAYDTSQRAESNDVIFSTTPVSIAANKLQNVWLDFPISKNAISGIYRGKIEITANEFTTPVILNYTIVVKDAVLDDPIDFVNGFDIELWQYPYTSAEYYGVEPFSPEHLEIMKSSMEIYKSVGGHAITASIIEDAWNGQTYSENPVHYPSMVKWTKQANGKFTYDFDHFDKWVTFNKEMGIGDKIVLYSIAPWGNAFTYYNQSGNLIKEPFDIRTTYAQDIWRNFLETLIAHVEEKGWFDDTYIGIDEQGFSHEAFDLIESVKNSKGEALKTAGAMDWFTSKYDLAMRVFDLNVGDTAVQQSPDLFLRLVADREAKGYKTTMYSCTGHIPGQFALSQPVESYWTMLNAAKYGVKGFLRWSYDAWVKDPLRDVTHTRFEPGDCFLIYPDEKNVENPTSKPSVRIERMAEGVRDINKVMKMVREFPELEAHADELYKNIQYRLQSGKGYLNQSQIGQLKAESASFKTGLDDLTDRYVRLSNMSTINGWEYSVGNTYYYENGVKAVGWREIEGNRYYFRTSGTMVSGWQYISGKWYLFNPDGIMLKSMQNYANTWYYLNQYGERMNGFVEINNQTYYFREKSGSMVQGWQYIEGAWRYFRTSGTMVTGWQFIGGNWYYFNSDGKRVSGFLKIGNETFFLRINSGSRVKGLQYIDGAWYGFNSQGLMLKGVNYLNGRWMDFGLDGKLK